MTRFTAFLMLIGLCAACARGPEPRRFELTGQVLAVGRGGTELVIRHDDVKGFMSAMTMPFTVKDPALARDRRPGDLVRATLMVTEEESWLAKVEKTGWAPVPAEAPASRAAVEIVRPGEVVPDATLVNQDGRAFRISSLRGSALLVTFVYTRCPLPDFCPRMDAYFAAVQAAVQSGRLPGQVHLLSVSFDPDFDTPAVLRAHAERVKADPRLWTFATAPRSEVEAWGARLGLSVIREPDNPAAGITHNLRTAVVAADGRLVAILEGNQWTPDEAIRALGAAGGR